MNSSNNKWLIEAPLSKNRNQGFYIETPLPKNRDQGFYIEAPLSKDIDRGFYYDLGKGKNWGNDDFLEGFYDPFGEKKKQERKERFAEISANTDNQIWYSQSINDPFLEGFNGISTEENKWSPDLLKEKTPEILSPQLPYDTDRSLTELQNSFRGSQFEGELIPTVQKINSSPSITPAINRNLNAKNEFENAFDYNPNQEPVMVKYSNDSKTSDFNKVLGNTLKRSFFEAFSPVFFKPSAHTALWFAGAETYLKNKGYDTSAWLLKHSLQPNPEDVYRDDNSRIAQLIKNDPAFLRELDKAIAESDGKTLDATLDKVIFESGDLYYSIHKGNIKVTGRKGNDGKWKISAKMDDKYNFSELMTGRGENGISLGTLANDVAYFSEKIGAITPYNIYVDFNIER